MIAPMLLFLLLAAPSAANLASARQSYSSCLGSLLRDNLRQRAEATAFEILIASSCKAEESAFRNVMVMTDIAAGTSRASAEQNAGFEVEDMVDNIRQRYRDYLEADTRPR